MASAKWFDKTFDLAFESFEKVYVRGDTNFNLTSNFDEWDNKEMFCLVKNVLLSLQRIPRKIVGFYKKTYSGYAIL